MIYINANPKFGERDRPVCSFNYNSSLAKKKKKKKIGGR
jgi:hypothetical protein